MTKDCKCIGYRHVVTCLGLIGLAICYIMRISPGVAILAMLKSAENISDHGGIHSNKFNWTSLEQNVILSSFFYTYFIMQLPAGWMVQYTGGKWSFAVGVSCCGLICLILPTLVRIGGFAAFLFLRLLQGLLQGLCYPSIHRLACKWFPPTEYACLSGVMHSGYIVGTVIALFCSGFLVNSVVLGGWASVFYASGILALIWLPAWLIFVSESPDCHPWIGSGERAYIRSSLQLFQGSPEHQPVPVFRLLRSPQVLLVMACYVMDGWGNYTLLVCVPQYMDSVLKVPFAQNGALSALPYTVAIIFMYAMTHIDHFLINRNILSVNNARKLWSALSSFSKTILLLTIAFLNGTHRVVIIVLLVVNVTMSSTTLLGFNLADLDLAAPYAGFLFSLFNACSTLSGMLAPVVVGAFTNTFSVIVAWRNIFVLASAISCLCGVVYVLFGKAATLEWIVEEQQLHSTTFQYNLPVQVEDTVHLDSSDEHFVDDHTPLLGYKEQIC